MLTTAKNLLARIGRAGTRPSRGSRSEIASQEISAWITAVSLVTLQSPTLALQHRLKSGWEVISSLRILDADEAAA
jgi:hypothetical protein